MYRHAFAKCVSFEARALKNRVTQQKRGAGSAYIATGVTGGRVVGGVMWGLMAPSPPTPRWWEVRGSQPGLAPSPVGFLVLGAKNPA